MTVPTSIVLAQRQEPGGETVLRQLSGPFTVYPVYASDLGELADAGRIHASLTVRRSAATSFFYYVDVAAARAVFDRGARRPPEVTMNTPSPALERLRRAARHLSDNIDEFGTVTDSETWSELENAMAAASAEGSTDNHSLDTYAALDAKWRDAELRAAGLYTLVKELEAQLEQAVTQSIEEGRRLRPHGVITAGSLGHRILRQLMLGNGYGASLSRVQELMPSVPPAEIEQAMLDLVGFGMLDERAAGFYVTAQGRMLAYRLGPVAPVAAQP